MKGKGMFSRLAGPSTLAAACLLALAAPSQAQDKVVGEEEYMANCAGCHGAEGRGDGPVAEFLNIEVADLTKLRANNDGQFPFARIIQVIDGRADVRAHGERPMPVWGARFSIDVGPDYRPTDPAASEEIVRGRIVELVSYLTSIQDPPASDDILFE